MDETTSDLIELTDDNFNEALAEGVWLVLYWDYTCGQCKLLFPVMKSLAARFTSRARVGRLNLTDSPRTAKSREIHFLPLAGVYNQGERVRDIIGVKDEAVYAEALDAVLGPATT